MDGKMQGLLAVNIGLAPIQRIVEAIKPTLGGILIVAQILVAMATAWYFYRKGKAVRVPKRRKNK